ncbi:MAG TPA: hypothetical protein DCL77_14575 [Prolixibacteraceae bacterium]|jgi:hypothetical protein|nr:hypothetical protein [Prolixibacteraceae bacterium]
MIVIKKFKGQLPVSFDPFLQEKECMVNATEMANIFGKQTKEYLGNKKTIEYLKVLEIEFGNAKTSIEKDQNLEVQRGNSPFETEKMEVENDENLEVQGEHSPLETIVRFSENILKVVKGGRNSGTWIHRYLAIDFAMWLDPYFNLWVVQTIDEIVFGFARKRDLSFKRTLEIKDRMKELKDKENRTGEDFSEYLMLDTELKQEQHNRSSITTERIKEIQILIFTENEMGAVKD